MWHAKSVRVLVILVMVMGALAVGILSPPSVPSLSTGTASADPAVPNPGHPYDDIELPGGTWTGLDADKLDGLDASQLDVPSRPGFSLTTLDSTGDIGYDTSVTVGADGLPIISYLDSTNYDLKVAHCGNVTCSSSTTTTVDGSTDNVGLNTSVTVGADGLPIISYLDVTGWNLKVAHCGDAACTSGNTITTVDSTDNVGISTSVTVGRDGLAIISYYDGTNGNLKVAHCGNVTCTSGNTITTVDSTDNVGLYTSVTVGADGLPIISYYDSTNGDLKVAHCGNADCTSGNTITTLDGDFDPFPDVGKYTSVTVGTDGRAIISYYDQTNGNLKVAHCDGLTCGSSINTTVDSSTDNVGLYTSVTVGADGLAIISYYDQTNFDLKVAHCGGVDCAGVNTKTTVDSIGNVGQNSSVTVGADGLGLISYRDVTNWDLKVAHCSNRFCVPYNRPR